MSGAAGPDRWLVDVAPHRAASPLLIFPHAGAGPSAYRRLAQALAGRFRPLIVHLPGREGRVDDPPQRDISALVRPLSRAVAPLLARGFACYGHSMGALVSFELARQVRRAYGIEPDHLVVSGHPAPGSTRPGLRHQLPDDDLLRAVRGLLGTPAELLADPQMRALLLPALRADFEVCETYRYRPERPLTCPISSFAGTDDDEATAADMAGWAAETNAGHRHQTLPGGHFFNLDDEGFADRLAAVLD